VPLRARHRVGGAPLPLIVYVHPSVFTADTLAVATNVLDFQDTADLTGDPARPGFIVVAPEGRATNHFYPQPDDQGTGWDNWYRQLVHNACDIAGICPNGELLLAQLLPLRARFTDVIIDGSQAEVMTCDPGCGTNPDADMSPLDNPRGFTEGTQNHTRWPTSWTESMLSFLRQYRGRRRG
jgi:hypothetical protein